MANVNEKNDFGAIGFYGRIALGHSEIISFFHTLRMSKFPQNASLLTDGLQTSGWKFLCPELAVVIHFELIWSHLGTPIRGPDRPRRSQDGP